MNQNNPSALRINVGFLLHQDIGTSRKFEFNQAIVQVADDLDVCNMHGEVQFTRTAQGLYGRGEIEATTPLVCVRCLTEYDQHLTVEFNDLFVYPPDGTTEPLLTIPKTCILDLSEIVRECLLLDIPIQPLCTPDCQGLCPICGDRMEDDRCEHLEENIDPRLAALQALLPRS